MSDKEPKSKKKVDKVPVVIKNATDLQRLKLEKLMKNPEKPVLLPPPPKEKTLAPAPDFVRNVMGSSAGAGSGEFHVYRHLRRKEYARQKFIQEKSEQEKKDEEYHSKIEANKRAAEDRTAKKRAKRLKKKKNAQQRSKKPKVDNKQDAASLSESSSEGEIGEQPCETKDAHDTNNANVDSNDKEQENCSENNVDQASNNSETVDKDTEESTENT